MRDLSTAIATTTSHLIRHANLLYPALGESGIFFGFQTRNHARGYQWRRCPAPFTRITRSHDHSSDRPLSTGAQNITLRLTLLRFIGHPLPPPAAAPILALFTCTDIYR